MKCGTCMDNYTREGIKCLWSSNVAKSLHNNCRLSGHWVWTPSAATRIAPGGAAGSPIFGEGRLSGGVCRDERRRRRQEMGLDLSVRGGGIILVGIFCVLVFLLCRFFLFCAI
mmetsp:Transcript_23321/g.28546  ORF Transcript_23321/g.28546 Transcript_23321/m.28546 type:complete len:113 (-) Transcript_23321:88-426(-)